ncbi:hypothetical protein GCM10027275_03650 [Rhabdobacter roseus]|uniref:DUF2281 domain-containing protein n=1 Tax=Rhabdobacter roseus TaxID=1655419 RepID=A0A840TH21_9BACT|nr:DUF2281 domain-containing protein [Rhabdobacter roseus]MBB5282255.1 hypothetical protein [Rhabdobacter roseus]
MIRTIVTPDQQNISIKLPQNFVGRQVEVIAFTIDDATEEVLLTDTPMTHLASEKVLAKEWLTTEEDKAWEDL